MSLAVSLRSNASTETRSEFTSVSELQVHQFVVEVLPRSLVCARQNPEPLEAESLVEFDCSSIVRENSQLYNLELALALIEGLFHEDRADFSTSELLHNA